MHLLQDYGELVNHKKVLRLMQEMHIQSRICKKRRQYYSPAADGRMVDNLLNRNFEADAPNRKWVTDITQYRVLDTWLYVSAIKDLCHGGIVSFQMSLRNDNKLVLETFSKAFEKETDVTGLIVHSDQGVQYTSHDYHDMLQKVGARISMSRRGNCHDNASMESFFSHLKTETLMISEVLKRHKEEFRNTFTFTTIIVLKES